MTNEIRPEFVEGHINDHYYYLSFSPLRTRPSETHLYFNGVSRTIFGLTWEGWQEFKARLEATWQQYALVEKVS